MKLSPITMLLGAEVSEVNLCSLSDVDFDEIYEALLDRGVLVFRGQSLTSEAHVALGRSFGSLVDPHPLYPSVEGFPDIIRVRNDENNPPENEVWHSDLSCRPNPPFVSVLRAALIPPVGGDTLWTDMRAVYDSLPVSLREQVASLSAVHSLAQGFRFLRESEEHAMQDDRKKTLNESDRAKNSATHPIVASHPATGRKLLYVNESFTESIVGLSESESTDVLHVLFDAVKNPRHQMRLKWQPGTVVIWDNWTTQHFASGDHYPSKREVQRVTVAANRRSGAFSVPAAVA
jgi:taurine dioxygenase